MENEKEFYEYELDGKKVSFHKDNIIEVHTGKISSHRYSKKWQFTPKEFSKAMIHYNGLNIGNGFKKRLICYQLQKPLLAFTIIH